MGVDLTVVSLLIALMQGALCKTWSVTLPQSIMGISNSCVTVSCNFEVPDDQEANILKCPNGGIWNKGSRFGRSVLNSHSPLTNGIQGQILGDLTKKDCTTVFHSFQMNYSDIYYFRLECPNNTKFTFGSGVSITVQTDPAPPQLTFVHQVLEGVEVRLQCSVPVPCSILRPYITWLPRDSFRQEATQMLQNANGQYIMTSTLTFIASADHHNQSITCSVSYPLSTGGSTKPSATSQRLSVLYAPRFTVATLHTSSPVSDGRTVMFICSSDANPPVHHYTWYRANRRNLTEMGEGETLVLQVSQNDSGAYLCEAQSSRGSQRSRPVSLEVSDATGTSEHFLLLPYIISGVLLVLYIITLIVTVYKYKSLSRRLKMIEVKGEHTYMNLRTCSAASDYDHLQVSSNIR